MGVAHTRLTEKELKGNTNCCTTGQHPLGLSRHLIPAGTKRATQSFLTWMKDEAEAATGKREKGIQFRKIGKMECECVCVVSVLENLCVHACVHIHRCNVYMHVCIYLLF